MKIAAVLLLAACGAAQQPQPQGLTVRLDAADVHKAQDAEIRHASTGTEGTPTYACGDTVLADQSTSGGDRLALATPCFDVGEEATVHQRYVSSHERAQAAQDRAIVANLAATDVTSCKGIPEREREHSPFDHHRAISEVIPQADGVTITFKSVSGLSANWLERDIKCHQARFAALGNPSSYLPDDPSLVIGAHVQVSDANGKLMVSITTPDPDAAHLAQERAKELVAPPVASN